jgi:hypothetical protein
MFPLLGSIPGWAGRINEARPCWRISRTMLQHSLWIANRLASPFLTLKNLRLESGPFWSEDRGLEAGIGGCTDVHSCLSASNRLVCFLRYRLVGPSNMRG